jgi:hypothetical protein
MTLHAFQSSDIFRQFFIDQLAQMLEHEQLGVFILVLANALSRKQIHQSLTGALQQRFEQLSTQLASLPDTQMQRIPADDLDVFRALERIGLETLSTAEARNAGCWQLQYHPLRRLRPARNSARTVTRLKQPFDAQAFHFNKPFLRKETLWQGEIASADVRLLYNKFPFADFHGLMVIDGEACKPQFLQQADCVAAQQVFERLSNKTALGMAYNSLGAYASVNHQHWQTFLSGKAYPVENRQWQHNGGAQNYPLEVEVYASLLQAWTEIDRLQQHDIAFNLFIRGAKTWLIKRRRQGDYIHSDWTGGFAWSETAGALMTTRREDFLTLEVPHIEQEFQRLKIGQNLPG